MLLLVLLLVMLLVLPHTSIIAGKTLIREREKERRERRGREKKKMVRRSVNSYAYGWFINAIIYYLEYYNRSNSSMRLQLAVEK